MKIFLPAMLLILHTVQPMCNQNRLPHLTASDNTLLVVGRVLVYNESDLTTAYNLSKQIQVTPLT
jgi:hypothetical protein